jgi:hypothetical protein
MDTTFEQRVKNHVATAAIFAGTFVLPCFIATKLLKEESLIYFLLFMTSLTYTAI